MSKKIPILYTILFVFSLLFLIYIARNFTSYEYLSSGEVSVSTLYATKDTSNDPQIMNLHYTLPKTLPTDAAIGFLSKHQSVEIKVEGNLVYSYTQGNNAFGRTPGIAWHLFRVNKSAQGKELEIYLHTPYKSVSYTPRVLLGSKLTIVKTIIRENMFTYLLCLLMIIIGIGLTLYWLNIHRSLKQLDNSLIYLGLFAIVYGIWSMNESPITILLMHNSVACVYLSHLSLMLIPTPFLMFVRNLYRNKDSHIWDFLCILSLGNLVLNLILQITNVADFKETLPLTHGVYLVSLITYAIFTILEVIRHTLSWVLCLNVICAIFVFFSFSLNLNTYFKAHTASNRLVPITFLVYIIIPTFYSMRNISITLKKVEEADFYHKMAYYDQLTKLYNRNAYNEKIKELMDQHDTSTFIIVCDLNNLKKCNDVLGHEVGDSYVQDAADILRSTFLPYGKCYRIGGDEFCILSHKSNASQCIELLNTLGEHWRAYTNIPSSFDPQIAYGYAQFDDVLDHDIHDTIKRADSHMYINKKASKL